MLLKAGDKIDRFLVRERVGIGGMAEVWLVVHEQLGTRHALKVLLHSTDEVRRRLEREGRAQSSLKHDNLVPVRDILDIDGSPALLMPLIEGPTLDELLTEYRPTREEALALFAEILKGVGHAHDCGYVHRDLKPANVLLGMKDGRVLPRVADFGLVKERDASLLTRDGMMMGTPAYAAPEQITNAASADEAADLFSLGVILVELLTGKRPFARSTPQMFLATFLKPPDLSDLVGPLATLARELLDIEPDLRPASCWEVLTRIGQIDPMILTSGDLCGRVRAGAQRQRAANATTGLPPVLEAPNNLPKRRDAFVGRAEELDELIERLSSETRLATITGLGGSGKTRLAMEFCRSALSQMTGGVYWVDLSDVLDRPGVLAATARALGVPLAKAPVEQLGRAIAGRGRCLVLFDNYERLTDDGDLLATWLDGAEQTFFVVTSRKPLQLRGEWVLPLATLEETDGVTLYTLRAEAANPEFALTDGNRTAVRELVSLLDGIPLALELAAARSRMYTAERLVSRIGQRFRLLRSDSADLPGRHRTLKAALQWSWDLLSATERSTLAQLTMFEGGFTLERADDAVDLSCFEDAPWVEDIVANLLDHSLLTLYKKGREPRFSMLTSVQEFAREKLGDPTAAARRHGALFAELAPRGRPTGRVVEVWQSELANLSAASRRACERGDLSVAVPCALAASEIYRRLGPYAAGLQIVKRVLALSDLSPVDRAELLYWVGSLTFRLGSADEAVAAFESGLSGIEALDAPRVQGMNMLGLSTVHNVRGLKDQALGEIERALSLLESADDPVQTAIARWQLGAQLFGRGQHAQAESHMLAVLATAQIAGRELPRLEALVLNTLAHHSAKQGRPEEARERLYRAHALAKRSGDVMLELSIAGNLRGHAADMGEVEPGLLLAHEQEALEAWRRIGDLAKAGLTEGRLGLAFQSRGELDEATRWLRTAIATHETVDHLVSQSHWWRALAEIALTREEPDEALACAKRAVASAEGLSQLEGPAKDVLDQALSAVDAHRETR